jgi:hypothetical protein
MLEKRGVRRTRARNSEVVGLSAAFVFLLLSIICDWFVAKVVQVERDAVYVSLLLVPIGSITAERAGACSYHDGVWRPVYG